MIKVCHWKFLLHSFLGVIQFYHPYVPGCISNQYITYFSKQPRYLHKNKCIFISGYFIWLSQLPGYLLSGLLKQCNDVLCVDFNAHVRVEWDVTLMAVWVQVIVFYPKRKISGWLFHYLSRKPKLLQNFWSIADKSHGWKVWSVVFIW